MGDSRVSTTITKMDATGGANNGEMRQVSVIPEGAKLERPPE